MNGRFVAGLFAGTCISLTSFSLGAYATHKFQQQLSNNNNLSLTTTTPTSLPSSPQQTSSSSSSLTTTKEEKITACFSKEQIESIIASDSFQKALFNYQAMKKPKRIILIRHGESEGNINPCIYATKPDNQIELTEEGKKQALHAGAKLKQIIEESSKKSGKPESIQFIISPYKRSIQTFEQLAVYFGGKDHVSHKEDARIRELDFGNFQSPSEIQYRMLERKKFGSFYYRFPQGESGADVYDRVSGFVGSLMRDFSVKRKPFDNYVLVSHGLTCRLFLMRYFHWTVDTFHSLQNLDNCEMVIMELQESGKYKIKGSLKSDDPSKVPKKDFVV